MIWRMARTSAVLCLCSAVVACGGLSGAEQTYPDDRRGQDLGGSLFGGNGITLFSTGGGGGGGEEGGGAGIGVNSYLWRAALDTVSFMPVTSADPFGGVIMTDWYTPAETPNERLKLNVYILDRELRADGVRVGVFRQVQDARGNWEDAAVTPETATTIEDAILTRARQLRIASNAVTN